MTINWVWHILVSVPLPEVQGDPSLQEQIFLLKNDMDTSNQNKSIKNLNFEQKNRRF